MPPAVIDVLSPLCFFASCLGCLAVVSAHFRQEVQRVVSPSGRIDAVVVESDAGATTGVGYHIYVLRRRGKPWGDPAATVYSAARKDGKLGVDISWQSSDSLLIEYGRARWHRLKNPKPVVDSQRITITVLGRDEAP